MKGWTTARTAGTCSYDRAHHWAVGDRIGAVQGLGWRKDYCAPCFTARHAGGADTGEYLEDIQQAPNYPPGLTSAGELAERFDARAKAARNSE